MGLVGTTSWTGGTKSNGTTIQRYKLNSATKVNGYSNNGTSFFVYHNYQNNEYGQGVELDGCGYCWFRVETDAAVCASLSFHCTGASRNQSGNKLYCRLSDSSEWSKSGGNVATYSEGWKYTFYEAKLLPNTYYYVHIWGSSVRAYGTMTITGSGTYGAPGDIEAPDNVDFNDPIEMTYGSATDGGRYTVTVQVGESDSVWEADTDYSEGDIVQYNNLLYKCLEDHTSEEGVTPDITSELWEKVAVTLQEYTEPTIPADATGTVGSETIVLDSINSETFKLAVNNEEGDYEFSYAGTDWYLYSDIVDLDDYGINITGEPEEGDTISVDFTAEILGGKNDYLEWTPLLSTYADDYPNQPTVPCLITVDTYFGTTLSGTKTKTVTVAFTQAQVGPEISNVVFTIAPHNVDEVTGLSGYIQNYSQIRAYFDDSGVTLKKSATISTWSVKFGNTETSVLSPSMTFLTSSIISETTQVLLVLKDSRGFTTSTTLTAPIIPYQSPTLVSSGFRGNSSGTPADDGTYVYLTYQATYADLDEQNTIELKVYSKLASDSDYGTGIVVSSGQTAISGTNKVYSETDHSLSGYSDHVYNIKVTATDILGNVSTIYFDITSQKWALHIRSGGDGAAFGKVSERDQELDIGNWNFRCGTITFNNSGIVISGESIASKLVFLRTIVGDTSITATVTGNITGATVNDAAFKSKVNNTFGTYDYSYDGRDWFLNGSEIDLSDYGITVEGIASEGDTIQVIFASSGSWVEKDASVSVSVSGTIEDAEVDIDTFENEIAETGTYIFTYDGTDWNYDSSVVDLTDYGIAVTGTAESGDEITIIYIAAKYEDYPYRATVPLTSVTESMIPEVIFGLTEATSGIFAPIVESYNGGIYLYASDDPGEAFLIPTIICWAN